MGLSTTIKDAAACGKRIAALSQSNRYLHKPSGKSWGVGSNPASVNNNKGDKKMNVSEIIAEWLKANQYDGLVDKETGCRCKVVDPDRPCDGRFCVGCEGEKTASRFNSGRI